MLFKLWESQLYLKQDNLSIKCQIKRRLNSLWTKKNRNFKNRRSKIKIQKFNQLKLKSKIEDKEEPFAEDSAKDG
jgi:hypothetical protein